MPDLDVSDILLDPDFMEEITVRRITQSVGSNGVATQSETIFVCSAVVTIGDMKPLDRTPEAEVAHNVITVHSTTPLRDTVSGTQPDIVVWKDSNYVVSRNYDWSHYGSGFTASVCELQDTVRAQ